MEWARGTPTEPQSLVEKNTGLQGADVNEACIVVLKRSGFQVSKSTYSSESYRLEGIEGNPVQADT